VALVARYFDIHPVNPQPRLIEQVVSILRDDGVIAYPTDSGYALGIQLGNRAGLDRMRAIRNLDDKHHFTLLCHDFAQMGPLVHLDNAVFRTVKAATPGPYTFILPATSEVPRRLMAPKKRTVGVRIPDHVLAHALLEALGEPLISTTLLLPGQTEPMTEGWSVKDQLDQLLDAVIEGEAGSLPTTVVDISSGAPEISRYGAGDAGRFE
jgi:tRNA threonylcarbamoyl adenosine modification protein (Sua5/YciO/YrdC/YwlC family)